MLVIDGISKSYGPVTVLNEVTLALGPGMKAGLVGINGSGKTTLLKIIYGLEKADTGLVSVGGDATLGFLSQSLSIGENESVRDVLETACREITVLKHRMEGLENRISSGADAGTDDLMEEYGRLQQQFEAAGGYEIEWRKESVLNGLGIGYIEENQTAASLSGGEKTRLALAALLLQDPDILLLDEPTNNLDPQSLAWFELYLSSYRGIILTASHDRVFLNNIVDQIFEIDEHYHTLRKFVGNYDDYRQEKLRLRMEQERLWQEQQEEIKVLQRQMKVAGEVSNQKVKIRDRDKFIVQFKTERKQQTASRNIKSAQERLSRLLEEQVSRPFKPLTFDAGTMRGEIRSAEVMNVKGLCKSYGDRKILDDISFSLGHEDRIVIAGPNGTGKTTLFRLLTGEEVPDSGSIRFSPGAKVGWLRQEPVTGNSGDTVLTHFGRGRTGNEKNFVFSLVTTGLFRYDGIRKKVSELSLGQVRKLELAELIANEPNVLLLDEPTNHLSLDVIESFETALETFRGPIIAISHDRRFIERFAGRVWELENGQLKIIQN